MSSERLNTEVIGSLEKELARTHSRYQAIIRAQSYTFLCIAATSVVYAIGIYMAGKE